MMPKNVSNFVASATLPETQRTARANKPRPLSIRSKVADFLQDNVPPSNTSYFNSWKVRAKSLGGEAVPYLIDVLRNGNEEEQYSALLALRENGYEAWGHGYDADFEYRVTINGEKMVIKPKHYEILE